jgi:hypothetical protein
VESLVKEQAVFTPKNEPYLGRKTVLTFDQLIVACLQENTLIAPRSYNLEKTSLQQAACQLISTGIHLSLSIRELVRQGYLYSALVLLRPLAERAITLLYLHKFPSQVAIWDDGWKYNKRPSLAKMIDEIGEHAFPNCGSAITQSLNSLIHGDPESAIWNLVNIDGNQLGHAVSKMLDRPDICDKVCMEASVWMSLLLGMMNAIFADFTTED